MSWQPPPPPPKPGATQTQAPPAATTFYNLLQVDPLAHPTVIRYAYRFLAAMYHPDNAESGDAEKFKTITEAWRTLSDSTARQAYDIQLGLKAQAAPTGGMAGNPNPGPTHIQPKASLSWSEVELRLAVLQVLMEAKRKKPQTGGASAKMLMDCLNCSMGDIEYVLWYLREKNYITRTESAFIITIQGVDYLIDQLSKTQPMDAGSTKAPPASGINLPATLG